MESGSYLYKNQKTYFILLLGKVMYFIDLTHYHLPLGLNMFTFISQPSNIIFTQLHIILW